MDLLKQMCPVDNNFGLVNILFEKMMQILYFLVLIFDLISHLIMLYLDFL